MFLLSGGHVQVDTLHPRVSHLLSIPVAGVGANGLGLGPHILLHLLQHRHQLLLVVALLRHLRRHDHLRFSIHRELRVVALHKAAFMTPIGHDPALRVGEVALRFRVGHRLLGIRQLRLTSAHLLAGAGCLFLPLPDLSFGGGLLFLFHSTRTFCNPRSKNRRNPRHSLICPNTGSTIALRLRYRACPASVFSFCFICSSNPASAFDSVASSSSVLFGSPCFCFPVATCKSIPCTRASPTCFPFQ